MTEQIIKDPPCQSDVVGYIDNKDFLGGYDFTIDKDNKTFHIGASLISTEIIEKYLTVTKRLYNKKDLISFPTFYLEYDKEFKLINCVTNQLERGLMPGNRIVIHNMQGQYEYIKYN